MKMSELKKAAGKDGPFKYTMQDMLHDVAYDICTKLCKYYDTGNEDGCEYKLKHEGECPLDMLD